MSPSLQRQLSISIAAAILGFGLLAAGVSFWLAFEEAQERQDDTLRQIAMLTDVSRLKPGAQSFEAADRDQGERIVVQRLDGSGMGRQDPLTVPRNLTAGFHTLKVGGDWWRVYAHGVGTEGAIAVAQDTASRNQIALDAALLSLLPLLALIPLLAWLLARTTHRILQPVRALAGQLHTQTPGDPIALGAEQMPEEIVPFICAIDDLLTRTRRLLQQQQRFIADAAHELRTPLTALSLQAQNVASAKSVESAHQRLIPLTCGITRAARLVDQLMHLSRQQAGNGAKTLLALVDTVQELLDDLLPLAHSRQITLRLTALSNPRMFAEAYPLRQLLRNALDNAVRYSPSGGEIEIEIGEEDSEVWVQIIDSGPGIPEQERTRVFEPFYRIPGSEGGSGLGLAIAHDAASRLGGRLSLANRTDRPGLIFTYRQMAPADAKTTSRNTRRPMLWSDVPTFHDGATRESNR